MPLDFESRYTQTNIAIWTTSVINMMGRNVVPQAAQAAPGSWAAKEGVPVKRKENRKSDLSKIDFIELSFCPATR